MRFLSLYFAIIYPLHLYFNALAYMLVYKCMLWLHSYFSFWKLNKRKKSAGLFPCITVIWLGQAYRYIFSYLSLFLISFSYSLSFTLSHAVAEGSKTIRFRSCQGHKISLALSNSSTYLAILPGKTVKHAFKES